MPQGPGSIVESWTNCPVLTRGVNGQIKTLKMKKTVNNKYVVKHKSAKLFMMYAVGKLETAPN